MEPLEKYIRLFEEELSKINQYESIVLRSAFRLINHKGAHPIIFFYLDRIRTLSREFGALRHALLMLEVSMRHSSRYEVSSSKDYTERYLVQF